MRKQALSEDLQTVKPIDAFAIFGSCDDVDELRGQVDEALRSLGSAVETAIESLRDALCEIDDPAVTEAIDYLDDELTEALNSARTELSV